MFAKSFLATAVFSACMLTACSSGGESGQSASSAPASGTTGALDTNKAYIVATDASYAPMEYMENDQVVGF